MCGWATAPTAGAGATATIASALVGSGGLVKSDFGTLILTGQNSYTGGTSRDGRGRWWRGAPRRWARGR